MKCVIAKASQKENAVECSDDDGQRPSSKTAARIDSIMIAKTFALPDDIAVVANSPAILRLRMLEMQFAAAAPQPESQRQSAYDLIGALKRAIVEKPSLSFADVVAKLKTCDDLARDGIGDKANDLQKDIMRSALADLRWLQPAA
jgi:hypothetical protein